MKIYIYTLIVLLTLYSTSCQDPDVLNPTVERNAITSLRATFTEGDYMEGNDGAANFELKIEDPTASEYIIQIPRFFPESSDNTPDITKMRVRAELGANCTLSPGLDILDLTKDNYFTLTYPDGSSRQINITGNLHDLTGTSIDYFEASSDVSGAFVVGYVNNETGIITLYSPDDLSDVTVNIEHYPHSTLAEEITGKKFNLNEPVSFTVTAHDGVTEKTYTTRRIENPAKVPYGISKESHRQMWSVNPGTLGVAWGTGSTALAVTNNHLVVSAGDGSTPIYLNKMTGRKIGTINLGDAKATGSVANDNNENLLIVNSAAPGETLNIFKTKSVTVAPTSFISYANTTGTTISRISVQGNIDGDAVIVATCDASNKIVRWNIVGGVVETPEIIAFSGVEWGAGTSNTQVTPLAVNKEDGYLLAYYDANKVFYVDGNTNAGTVKMNYSEGDSWGLNFSRLDVKMFNGARYFALASMTHFPHWGMEGKSYLYDAAVPSALDGDIPSSSALVFSAPITRNNVAEAGVSANGDIVLAPSSNGYFMYMFCWDNNAKTIIAHSFDCIVAEE